MKKCYKTLPCCGCADMETCIKEKVKVVSVDIWSAAYNQLKPYIHAVEYMGGKTLYESCLGKFYYLYDSKCKNEYL
nr:MAG TPA: hypothetical protein [Caudoviricetes sp.]